MIIPNIWQNIKCSKRPTRIPLRKKGLMTYTDKLNREREPLSMDPRTQIAALGCAKSPFRNALDMVYDVYVELYRCPDRSGSPHQNGNKISTERPLPWRHGRHRKRVRKFGESTASLGAKASYHASHQTLPAWH